MKVFVSAAEISSDIHAEKILKSLQKILNEQNVRIEWMGIGGPLVRALPGFNVIESAENLRTMGFIEVLKRYGFFKKLIQKTTREISQFNPDMIITFDYPDFHFRVLEQVNKNKIATKALKVCGIPPKVWVWRSKRVEKIKRIYDGVWVIFPFEKIFYESKGIPVIYEGNPLLESLNAHSLIVKKPLETITVMPGSREAELKYHLPVIPMTLELFAKKVQKKITAQIPVSAGISIQSLKEKLKNSEQVEYVFLENNSVQSLKETQIGLIKSGTSTLEAAVLNCIPVIFYKMNFLSEHIFKWLIQGWSKYLGPVGLPNILLGVKIRKRSPFKELLGSEATPENLSNELFHLYSSSKLREELNRKNQEIRDLFNLNRSHLTSSDASAEQILKWQQHRPVVKNAIKLKSNAFIFIASQAWSSVNWIRRRLAKAGLYSIYQVKAPSILVGNLQAGGAGKTPLVIALAKEAMLRGKKVAVVSRGYGRSKEMPLGDEAQEILNSVPGLIVSVGSNRVKAIQEAEKQKPDLIIFDDGFQNLHFKTRINLIAVTDRKRNEVVYRDFDSEIKFADFVIGTKGQVSNPNYTKNKNQYYPLRWVWDNPIEKPVWLFCAIADPAELVRFYEDKGLKIKKMITKPDHAALTLSEIKNLIDLAIQDGCSLAMTEKDRVKVLTLSSQIYVLKRSIQNRDWIEAVFSSKLLLDEKP